MTPLDAIQGVPNAAQPLPNVVTGGQPTPEHLARLKEAGVELVLDIRDPSEPRGFDEAKTLAQLGIEYAVVPVHAATMNTATLDEIVSVLREHRDRSIFFHCGSGNRVGGALVPYLVLDHGRTPDEALQTAMTVGLRSRELLDWGNDYLRTQQGA